MARIVLTDAKITVNGVNLSNYCTSVTLNTTTDVVETTAFSSTAAKTRISGLQDNSVSFEWTQDYGTSLVEATIYPLLGTTTTIVVSPTSTSPGTAANPSYTFTALISEWQPLSGGVGELATATTSFPISGAITKAAV
jgi:hypothetical protein